MAGLLGTLADALSGLQVSQQELATTSNNVANAGTPGYTRERADISAGDPVTVASVNYGTGVVLDKIESLRDPILQIQVNQATGQDSALDASLAQLQQLQTQFASASSGIGADISNFFSSVQQLSSDPTSLELRESLLTAAGNLATDFNRTASSLAAQRGNIDLNVQQSVSAVNTLSAQIAGVNRQIESLQNAGQSPGTLVDQRNNLVQQLSGLVGVSVIPTDNGISVALADGTTLVSGSQSFALSTQTGSDGVQHVLAAGEDGGEDITGSLSGGSLGGLIQVRDTDIPSVQNQLDQLAAGVANGLNSANKGGFDLNGAAGTNLFVAPPANGVGAAANLAVAITDPSLVAASSDGTSGSNGNLAAFSAVATTALANGQTPINSYSSIVFQVGNQTANNSADADASGQILQQLQDQVGSVSGVSLNEEAANLIQFQTAYQAAAKVVSAVNNLLLDAVNLGLGAAEE